MRETGSRRFRRFWEPEGGKRLLGGRASSSTGSTPAGLNRPLSVSCAFRLSGAAFRGAERGTGGGQDPDRPPLLSIVPVLLFPSVALHVHRIPT